MEEDGAADITTQKQIAEFDGEYQALTDLGAAKIMILREFNNHLQIVAALERKTENQAKEIEALKAQLKAANSRSKLQKEQIQGMQVQSDEKKVQIKNQQDLIDRQRRENDVQRQMLGKYEESYSAVYANYKAQPEGLQTTNGFQNSYYQDPQSDLNSIFSVNTTNHNQQVQDSYYPGYPQSNLNAVSTEQSSTGYSQIPTPKPSARVPATPSRTKKRKAEVLETDWFICRMETKPGNSIICGGLNEKMIKKGAKWEERAKCKHCGRNTWAQFKQWVSPENMVSMAPNHATTTTTTSHLHQTSSPQSSAYTPSPPTAAAEPFSVYPFAQPMIMDEWLTTSPFADVEIPSAATAVPNPQHPVSTYKPNHLVRTAPRGSMMMPDHPDGSL